MDNELFLRRLSELTEWHRPQLGPNGTQSVSKGRPVAKPEHPGPLSEADMEAMSEEELQDYYQRLVAWQEAQPNPTLPIRIKNIRPQQHQCEDCERILEEPRRVEIKLIDEEFRVWRHRCANCNHYRNTDSGEWDLVVGQAHSHYGNYIRRLRYQRDVKGKK